MRGAAARGAATLRFCLFDAIYPVIKNENFDSSLDLRSRRSGERREERGERREEQGEIARHREIAISDPRRGSEIAMSQCRDLAIGDLVIGDRSSTIEARRSKLDDRSSMIEARRSKIEDRRATSERATSERVTSERATSERANELLTCVLCRAGTAQKSSGGRGGYDDAKSERYESPRRFNLFDGWRSSDLPTAIAPRHPVRSARLHS